VGSVEAIRDQPEMAKRWSSQQARKGGHSNVMLEAKLRVVGSSPTRDICKKRN